MIESCGIGCKSFLVVGGLFAQKLTDKCRYYHRSHGLCLPHQQLTQGARMKSINEDMSKYMAKVVEEEKSKKHDGKTATTMEMLNLQDHELFGIAAVGKDGHVEKGAEAGVKFPLESVSKALGLAL